MAKNSNDKGMRNSVVNKRDLSESETPGLDITKKNQKASKKDSDAYYKEVKKKVDGVYGKKNKPEVEPVKHNYSDNEKELHDELEIRNGLEMIEYDNEPDETFKKRAKDAIEGSSIMGNKGDEGGNTDPVWGSHDKDFGKNLIKQTQASKKKRDDAKLNYVALGDDMELNRKTANVTPKKLAFENYTHFVVTDGKIVKGLTVESNSKEDIKKSIVDSMDSFRNRINESTKTYSKLNLEKLGLDYNLNENWVNGKYEDSSYQDLVSYRNQIQEKYNETLHVLEENSYFGNPHVETIIANEHKTLMEEIDDVINHKRDMIKEDGGYDPEYTHFLIHKATGTIIDGYDFRGSDKQDIIDSVKEDLRANFDDEIKPKDVKILTRKSAEKQGIELNSNNSYYNYTQQQQGINEGKIKSLKFKKSFGGVNKALTLIPESYKVNNRKFEMTDGNETYLIRWEGSLNEGRAVVLNEENAKVIQESYDKVKHLIAFDGLSKSRMSNKERSREEDLLKFNIKHIKKTIAEANKANEKSTLISESKIEKPVKEKFVVRQLDLSETASKYAEVKKAAYLKEGESYEGVVYDIKINESVIPVKVLAEDISQTNKNKKPIDRMIKFRFTNPDGSQFEL